MALTDPPTEAPRSDAEAEAEAGTSLTVQAAPHGTEPLSADLQTRGPRVSTRTLVYAVGVVALLVLVSGVVALVVLHTPRLAPVPVPSVSAIS